MNSRIITVALGVALGGMALQPAPRAVAQDGCCTALEDCSVKYQAASALIGGGSWRDWLPAMLKNVVAELKAQGVSLSEATLKATHESADVHQQLAALHELASATRKIDSAKAKNAGKSRRAVPTDTAPAQAPAAAGSQPIQSTAIKQKAVQ